MVPDGSVTPHRSLWKYYITVILCGMWYFNQILLPISL